MIRYLSTVIFILLSLPLFAQFRMVGTGAWSVVDDSTYTSTVTLQTDLTGQGYLATQIVDSFRVFTGTEQVYDITIVGATTFSTAELTIQERGGDWGAPVGQVMVYNPDGKETLPEAPAGSIGSTFQMTAAITTYNSRISQDEYVRIVGRRLFVDRDLYTGEPKVGDPLKPFRDPWQAAEAASPGDMIEILNGTYIAVDSGTMAAYPNYDILTRSEDPGEYNFMRSDSLTYHFNKGTAIQWSSEESWLAYDTLGYSLHITGDGILYTTEDQGSVFNVQGIDTDQLGTLDVRFASMIDTRNHVDSIYDFAPRTFYLQNLHLFKLDVDYIEGDHQLVAWDGEYGTQTSDIYIRDWNAIYSDYTFLIQGDTLVNQSHHIRIDNLNIEDFEYNWCEINRSYHWENTNFTFDIENAFADQDSIITKTEGSNNTESSVFSWLGGAFWTTAVKLADSNITFDVENCHSNVPLLQMIYAPDATEASNFNYRFKGNYFHNTDYAGSTGKGIYFPRSWTPPDGFNIHLDGNFISADTTTLIEIRPGSMVFTGRFITQGSEPVISFHDASSGTIDMVNAHLFNDGTVAEIQAGVAKSINTYGSWNTTNFDADVTINRYPSAAPGGILDITNKNASIPTDMVVSAVDSFTIEGNGSFDEPTFKLKWDNAGLTSQLELLNFDINTTTYPTLLTVADLIGLYDNGVEKFRWRYANDGTVDEGDMVLQGHNGVDLVMDATGGGYLGFQADDYIRIGDGGEDSLLIKVDLPPIAVDSLMGKTPDGQVTMVAKTDVAAVIANQYAQVYMTGGTNNGVDNGTPERINNTTVGTVTSIVATSEFTNEADGDIQYTGANNRVIKLTADISIDGGLIDDVIYCYIAINGTVVPTSRTGLVTVASDVDGNATINFIDVDADTNDTYAVYVEPDTGTGFTFTIIDVRLTAETLN